ncbi:MAG: hypothetical protein JW717_11810 [Marinilabiliaceae bacterium]|nr:hypothetical protein [Marinilabiliaceae bacterium]
MRRTIFTCLLSAVALLAGSSLSFAQTLKHAYTFDSDTATKAYDTVSINPVHGTLNGSKISIADGSCTVAGSTASTDGYVAFDGADLALYSYSAITMEYYVKSGNTLNSSYTMMGYFGNNLGGDKCLWFQPTRNGTESRVEADNGSSTITAALSGVEVDDGALHHVVVTLSSSALQYYLDGILVAESLTNGADYISTLDTVVAQLFKGPSAWGDRNYNGSIDEFNIYEGVMDITTVENKAIAYGVLDPNKTAILTDLSVAGAALTPAFNPATKEYVVVIPVDSTQLTVAATPKWTGIVTGDGAIDVSSGSATATVTVTSQDNSASDVYTVYFVSSVNEFIPLYDNLDNLVPDPEITDLTKFAGWGSKSINVNPAFVKTGLTSGKITGQNGGSIDIFEFEKLLKQGNSYEVRAIVYVEGTGKCQIGFENTGSGVVLTESTKTNEWDTISVKFTVTNLGDANMWFNNWGISDADDNNYIDSWEIYRLPKKVAYVTEAKVMASKNQPANDPIVQMLNMDPNIDVEVMLVSKDSLQADLSAYDAVVFQEPFSSSGKIWTPAGLAGLEYMTVPFIYNKAYAFKNGKAVTDADCGAVDPGAFLYLQVDTLKQANPLFKGIAFAGDSVKLFNAGATDLGADGAKTMQYVTKLDMSNNATLLGMIKGAVSAADTSICLNDIPAGTVLGTADTLKARMIAISQNYGAICNDGNMTEANLTLWRNAIYSAAGLEDEIPATPVYNSISVSLSASAGTFNYDNATNYALTLPVNSTGAELVARPKSSGGVVIPEISGLTNGSYAMYDVIAYSPIGYDSVVYNVAVHVQDAEEVMYLSANSNGVVASAKQLDIRPYEALVDAGYSVTFAKKGLLGLEAQPRDTFDYSPYSALIIAAGESSSNILVYAQDGYQIPCVNMQADGPRKTKWGWITTDKDDNIEMNVTKVYSVIDSIKMMVTNTNHYITNDFQVKEMIQWNNGTPDSADWSGREIKSYNLSTAVPTAVALGRIAADGTSLNSWYAIPEGSVLNTRYKDASNASLYKLLTTTNRIVHLGIYSDGLLYATPEGATMLVKSVEWILGANLEAIDTPSEVGGVQVAAQAGAILVQVAAKSTVAVYTIDGKVVSQQVVEPGVTTIPAQAGAYVVNVDGEAVKVMVTE